ncbi:MAG: flagellar filament capping protein FliD [Betaproteobacteria bacterium]
MTISATSNSLPSVATSGTNSTANNPATTNGATATNSTASSGSSNSNFLLALKAGSGIDTATLAKSLATAEFQGQQNDLNKKLNSTQASISGYGILASSLSQLQSAFNSLAIASDYTSLSAADNANGAFQAITSANAVPGGHSVNVLALAEAQRSLSLSYASASTALATQSNSETITLTLVSPPGSTDATKSHPIVVKSTDTNGLTPQGVVDAVNAQSTTLGVTATLINTGNASNPYRISLQSNSTGSAHAFAISSDNPNVVFDNTIVSTGGFTNLTNPLNNSSPFNLNIKLGSNTKTVTITGDTSPQGVANAVNSANIGVSAQLINTGDSATPYAIAFTPNDTSATSSLSISASTLTESQGSPPIIASGKPYSVNGTNGTFGVGSSTDLHINGVAISTSTTAVSDIAAAINTQTSQTGVSATVVNNQLQLLGNTNGINLKGSDAVTFGLVPSGSYAATASTSTTGYSVPITLQDLTTSLNSGNAFNIHVSTGSSGTTNLTISGDTSPKGIVKQINQAGLGITATIDASKNQIVLTTTDSSGIKNTLNWTTSQLSATSVSGTGSSIAGFTLSNTPQTQASNANLVVDGVGMSRASNNITDAIKGVTLNLAATTPSTAILNITQDTSTVSTNIEKLVTAFNSFRSTFNTLNTPTATGTGGGSLAYDPLLNQIRAQMTQIVVGNSSTPGTSISGLSDIGISIQSDGTLTLNSATLATTLSNNYADVKKMMTGGAIITGVKMPGGNGLAGDAFNNIDKFIKSTGPIQSYIAGDNQLITGYQGQLTDVQSRMTQALNRYTSQFANMDKIVGQMTSLQDSLKSQFTAMLNSYSK